MTPTKTLRSALLAYQMADRGRAKADAIDPDDESPKVMRAQHEAWGSFEDARNRLAVAILYPDASIDPDRGMLYAEPRAVVWDGSLYVAFAPIEDILPPGTPMLPGVRMSVLRLPLDQVVNLDGEGGAGCPR